MDFRLFLPWLVPACLLAQSDADRLVRATDPLSPEEERSRLHVPDGFTVQLFAAEPLIHKPVNLAFDARGRLWVSSTAEYPFAAARDRWADDQGSSVRDSPDAIRILEDTDGDGQADRVTVFADGLNIPTGVLPWHRPEHADGCIAWSIPNIWYFADTDGDGRADLREVLFGPLGYEKDTHGMCSSFRLGPDGWVYATHGFNNTSRFRARDGSTLDLHSGNVFRFRPDASRVEGWSSGQVNPFGLAWDRRGNLYSADCHSNPVTQLLRGACYPSFGKPHDGLGFAPVMCSHQHCSTGLCGIVYLDGGIWGPDWEDRILLGNCVTSRINRDLVAFSGTTPTAQEEPDFLVSDDPWFRPVDLTLGPDHALYVADFYNRVIGHYEVPLDHPGRDRERGRIWRIVKADAASAPRPSLPLPRAGTTADLASPDPFTRRSAASWFSAHPDPAALPALLDALRTSPDEDPSLRHQFKLAVRDVLSASGGFDMVRPQDHLAVREVSVAVPTAEAAAFLADSWFSPDQPPPDPAVWAHLARHGSSDTIGRVIAFASQLASVRAETLAALHQGFLERGGPLPPAFVAWITALAETRLSTAVSPNWEIPTSSPWCVQDRPCADGVTARVVSSLDRSQPAPETRTGILRSLEFPAPAKLSFWICGHRGAPDQPPHTKNLVRLTHHDETIHEAFPPRSDTCQRVEWDLSGFLGQPVRLEIVDGDSGRAYAWLGVTRIEPAVADVASFEAEHSRHGELALLAGILRTTAPAGLRDRLAPYLPPAPAPALATPPPDAELAATLAARRARFASARPDPSRGQAVFATHCAACHQVAAQGGLIGPQLDGIGTRGADRIIEDILDPNRNVDAHFRLHRLTLRTGDHVVGFVRGTVGQTMILVDAAGTEHRLGLADILANQELPVSLMPPNFAALIGTEDFEDLVAWLASR